MPVDELDDELLVDIALLEELVEVTALERDLLDVMILEELVVVALVDEEFELVFCKK